MKSPMVVGAAAMLLLALAPQGTASALTQPGVVVSSTTDFGRGNVTAAVPGSAIAGSDGVDHTIRPNRNYRAEFVVWIAPNVTRASVVLHATGATLTSCTSPQLKPGTTSTVKCLLHTRATTGGAAIDVVVRTTSFGTFSRAFSHVVSARNSGPHPDPR